MLLKKYIKLQTFLNVSLPSHQNLPVLKCVLITPPQTKQSRSTDNLRTEQALQIE